MKKVFALILAAMLLMSVSALATKSVEPIAILGIDPDTVTGDVTKDSELVQKLADAIAQAGMDKVFGGKLEDAGEYELLELAEITLGNVGDEETINVTLSVPAVKAGDEVAVMIGLVDGTVVTWEQIQVVSVEDGIVTIAISHDQAVAVQEGTAVIAVLVK